MAVTELISCAVAVAFNRMDQMVFAEEIQRTEDVRLVDGANLPLQLCQGLGLHGCCQCLDDHNPVGCGFDLMLFEQLDAAIFVHSVACFFIFGYKDKKKSKK
jgi:hypothetical protein